VSGARATVLAAAVAAGVAAAAARLGRRPPPGAAARWERVNYRGRTVSLAAGPALAAGAAAGLAVVPGLAPAVRGGAVGTVLATGALGLYDDLAGSGSSRGFRGHVGALRRGEVTTGIVKIVGIGTAGLAGAATVSDGPVAALVGGAAVAGSANLLNLLDLRPGRALKVGLLHAPLLAGRGAAPALAVPPLAAGLALLPGDLGEQTMLGDAGANALGSALGLAVVSRAGLPARLAYLAVLAGLTAASERVSFSAVIERTPVLHRVDQWGRLPAPVPAPAP
jgi:hypothetical protein